MPAKGLGVYQRRRPEKSVLYRVVQNHLESYLALAREGDPSLTGVPSHVEQDYRRYIRCGILAHGFARVRCTCGHDFLVGYSCRGRGACPSCNARRMVETAAHLVDHVFPLVPVRQWVLVLPKRLRYFVHHNAKVAGDVLRQFHQGIEANLKQSTGVQQGTRIGAVSFPQRFGSSLNAHYHYHSCVIDGVIGQDDAGRLRFWEAAEPTPEAMVALQERVRRRVLKYFVRHGLLEAHQAQEMLGWEYSGFSVNAAVRIEAHDREGLERLLRYCARGPLALERLAWVDGKQDRLIYRPAKTQAKGQAKLLLEPVELLDRLSKFIVPPRVHRHRYYGVLAPNAPLRGKVTALAGRRLEEVDSVAATDAGAKGITLIPIEHVVKGEKNSRARYLWAILLARIYQVLPLACPRCGEPMRIIAFIQDTTQVKSILDYIGEPSSPPELSPSRDPPEFEQAQRLWPNSEYEFDQSVSW